MSPSYAPSACVWMCFLGLVSQQERKDEEKAKDRNVRMVSLRSFSLGFELKVSAQIMWLRCKAFDRRSASPVTPASFQRSPCAASSASPFCQTGMLHKPKEGKRRMLVSVKLMLAFLANHWICKKALSHFFFFHYFMLT